MVNKKKKVEKKLKKNLDEKDLEISKTNENKINKDIPNTEKPSMNIKSSNGNKINNSKKKVLDKLKEIKVNKFQIFLSIIVLFLVILSYNFVGEIDTSQTNIESNPIINIPVINYEINLQSTSLLLAAVVIGLLDGFNPCAMWVLIYLISLASTLKDKRKMVFIVGTFVITEAIMYYLVLAGWLNLFQLVGISTYILYIVGAFALWSGAFSINEYIKTGGEVTCDITSSDSKKKTMNRIETIMNSPINIASIFAIIVLAIVVNSIEFVCSFGLPAIFTQMLAIADISSFSKYMYIAIYDLFFMIDDFIIFGLAFWALNSDWMAKYSGFSKLFGGIIMIIIGILLLFFPTALL